MTARMSSFSRPFNEPTSATTHGGGRVNTDHNDRQCATRTSICSLQVCESQDGIKITSDDRAAAAEKLPALQAELMQMDRQGLRTLPEQSQLSAVDDPGKTIYVCLTRMLESKPTAPMVLHGSHLVYMLQGLRRPARFYRRQRCEPALPFLLPWCIRTYVVPWSLMLYSVNCGTAHARAASKPHSTSTYHIKPARNRRMP